MGPGRQKTRARGHARAQSATQFPVDGVEVDPQQLAIPDHLPPRHKELRHMRLIGACEQQIEWIHRHDRVTVETVEILSLIHI